MAVDRLIWKVLLDFVIALCLGFILLALSLWVEPFERGYFANDQSLRLPYKPNLISDTALSLVGFAVIIVMIITVEVLRDRRGRGIGEKYLSTVVIPGWVWESYIGIGVYAFGAACQQLTVDAGKLVLGRLRPHFFDVCNPTPVGATVEYQYITNYTCNQTNSSLLRQMRLSFPSGHSSFAMYTAVYLIFYIQAKCKWSGSKLLRHAIQYAILMCAWFVGLSRVVDHQHFWSDVAAGFLIGTSYAAFVFIYVLKPKKFGMPASWSGPQPEGPLPRPAMAR